MGNKSKNYKEQHTDQESNQVDTVKEKRKRLFAIILSVAVVVGAILVIIFYCTMGLFSTVSESIVFDLSATELFCSVVSVLSIVIYIIQIFARKKKWRIGTVIFLIVYGVIYFFVDHGLGTASTASAIGSACTILGLTTFFLDYIREELSSLMKSMNKKSIN